MAFMEARRGRDRQLYEGIYRLVSGCVPYRSRLQVADEASCQQDRIEVLMVSTPNRTDLVFPKGGWEDDESVEEAACREALEEAGVRGILHKTPLGLWKFRSRSMQARCTPEGWCKGYMFPLEVTEELEIWPEMESHGRRWVSIEEAFQLCRYDWMREALSAFVNLMVKENYITIQQAVDGPASVSTPVVYDCHTQSPECFVNSLSTELMATKLGNCKGRRTKFFLFVSLLFLYVLVYQSSRFKLTVERYM